MEGVKELLSEDALEEIQAIWKHMGLTFKGPRPWKEFFEVFKPTGKDLERRMSTNLLHYKANYCRIFAGIMCVGVFCSPRTLLGLCISAVLVGGVMTLKVGSPTLKVGQVVVPLTQRNRALASFACALLTLALFGVLLWLLLTFVFALLLPLAHMALRPRNFAAKYGAATDEVRSLFGAHSVVSPSSGASAPRGRATRTRARVSQVDDAQNAEGGTADSLHARGTRHRPPS